MENTFIVVFDFNRLRNQFIQNDEWDSEVVKDYIEESSSLKNKMMKLFPNKVIDISVNSFIIKSKLNEEELLNKLIEDFSDIIFGNDLSDNVNRQIYISKINNLNRFTFNQKNLELDYIFNSDSR